MFPPESSAAQGLSHCNGCGACCRISPCLLAPSDYTRLARHLGETKAQFAKHIRIERLPDGKFQVRMKPPCDFLNGNECTIQAHKPKGGAEFECWTPATYALSYHWTEKDFRAIGANVTPRR